MIHWQLLIAISILIALTLPGTIELTMITFAGILPARDRMLKGTVTSIAKLAVVIPAHNEAGGIVRCVRSVAACTSPDSIDTEIVVVADNCTDATANLARGANARVLERLGFSRSEVRDSH